MADEGENHPGASPLTVFHFTVSFSRFYSRRGLGIHKLKLMNNQTEHEVME